MCLYIHDFCFVCGLQLLNAEQLCICIVSVVIGSK
jgi:hypothetical protein